MNCSAARLHRSLSYFRWVVLLTVLVSALGAGAVTAEPSVSISATTRLFLDAYTRGDRGTILRLIEPKSVIVYGSDAAEIARGSAQVVTMLGNDARLWHGKARIGKMEHVSFMQSNAFASIFFDAPFSLDGKRVVPVRFAMVWRRASDGWKLVQSSNVVPTQGQSAEQLLKPKARMSGHQTAVTRRTAFHIIQGRPSRGTRSARRRGFDG